MQTTFNKYKLAQTILIHPSLHGDFKYPISTEFLIIQTIRIFDINNMKINNNVIDNYINRVVSHLPEHPDIRNYKDIVSSNKNRGYDIIQEHNVIDNEGNIISCSIKKTIFLRLFQKKIRNYLNSRRNRVLQ